MKVMCHLHYLLFGIAGYYSHAEHLSLLVKLVKTMKTVDGANKQFLDFYLLMGLLVTIILILYALLSALG